ncbi:FAD-dependent monooxygenase [Planotetraspora phitsanulokensis]|uniref:FAD-dependent oxidoreductase n=1 Tax=Planotetraspora phitsanulokensis TaxID=575192 RepID=A0A8J3U1N5_9ACTN|nr:FAD-dependent oxidoreductase [Planotetraspora phitsanulokensis]GII36699.1 FAD-dependent oxidoreductase [Planotetraspora phitsanulokensis]
MDVDVVVAGAGPVGLMLACELRLAGVSVLVLERKAEPDHALRAGAMGARSINAPSADAFHRRGLLEAVREAALWWYEPDPEALRAARSAAESRTGAPRDRRADAEQDRAALLTTPDTPTFAGHFAGIPIRADRLDPADRVLAGHTLGGGAISQLALEEILSRRAASLGVEIRRGTPLTGLEADADGVNVLAGGEVVRAGWLAGCDGGRSTVRALAGFAFPGTDGEFVGRQAMVELAGPARLPVGDWVRTAAGAYVHGPVPGRVHTVEYGQVHDRDTPVTAEEMRASLLRVSGVDVEIAEVLVGTRYTDATRQAATYRRGRVLLAGDAAHIHSPAGGQGLNLGIGDAMNLGWKLAATVRGWAPDDLLDTYTAERHPVGAWVQGWSDAQSALGRVDARTAALRKVMGELLDTTCGATYVLKQISGIGRGYDLPGDHPLIGLPAPDLSLPDGTRLAEHCRTGRALLVTGEDDRDLPALAGSWANRMTVITAKPGPSMLVRPDGHIAWAADGVPDPASAEGALRTWLGAPEPRI